MGELLPVIIGSSGVTAVMVAVITALFNRGKLKADATSLITQAAGGLVTSLQADNVRLRTENTRNAQRRDRKESAERRRDNEFRRQLERHHEYDVQLVRQLRAAGIEVPDPPELDFPDYNFDDGDFTGSDGPHP